MKTIDGDQLRGHLEAMVLSVLESGEGHGYDVLKRLHEISDGMLALREGSVYPALYRLEDEGLVKAKWESGGGQRRGPRRRIYRITEKGRRALARRRDAWLQFAAVVGRVMEATT